jgi:pseudouridine kinase
MSEREKQILKILRRNPLIQQHEIAQILDISRSRVAAHIMDLMRKGLIKGKGYILTEQDYCVALGAINMDIRGVADVQFGEPSSHPGAIQCAAGGVARNIAHNLALLGRDVHLISAVGSDFYGETLLEQTRLAGVNVQNCIRLHGQSTSTYLSIASPQNEAVLAINDTHILQGLTPQLLNSSRELLTHAGVVLADCNLTPEALEWVFTLAGDIPVFVDTVSEFKAGKVATWMGRIHTLKPTLKELQILAGCEDPDAALAKLHEKGVQRIVVCLEDDRVLCSEKGEKPFLLAPPVHPVVDRFASDDAFMAGLIYGYLDGSDFAESCRFALACAALSRASVSVNNPTLSADNALYLLANPA